MHTYIHKDKRYRHELKGACVLVVVGSGGPALSPPTLNPTLELTRTCRVSGIGCGGGPKKQAFPTQVACSFRWGIRLEGEEGAEGRGKQDIFCMFSEFEGIGEGGNQARFCIFGLHSGRRARLSGSTLELARKVAIFAGETGRESN